MLILYKLKLNIENFETCVISEVTLESTTLSKKYQQSVNETQTMYYSPKFVVSPSKQVPSKIIQLANEINTSKHFVNAFLEIKNQCLEVVI